MDGNGNVGLVCTRTSEQEFPSVYVMMHVAGNPPGTMRPAVRGGAGTTYFRGTVQGTINATGWGNYSSTCIDPSDPTLIWTCQEYANSPLATLNTANGLPAYVGALPPGPAPKEGDWFTKLRERWEQLKLAETK